MKCWSWSYGYVVTSEKFCPQGIYTKKIYIKNKWRVLNGILKEKELDWIFVKKNWWIGLSSFYKSTNHSDTIWFFKKTEEDAATPSNLFNNQNHCLYKAENMIFFKCPHQIHCLSLFFTTLPERLTICLSSICLVELTAHAIPFLMLLIIFVM